MELLSMRIDWPDPAKAPKAIALHRRGKLAPTVFKADASYDQLVKASAAMLPISKDEKIVLESHAGDVFMCDEDIRKWQKKAAKTWFLFDILASKRAVDGIMLVFANSLSYIAETVPKDATAVAGGAGAAAQRLGTLTFAWPS